VSQQLNEELLAGDLRMLVDNIFEVDSYASKMGSDKDIVVVSFTVEQKEPADDLVNFCERGYDFILDADATPGELNDGKYKVFVEMERTKRIPEQIIELLDGVGKLCEIDKFKFRYYKGFSSMDVNEQSLRETIPTSKDEYDISIKENRLNNFSNFFGRSYLESIHVENDDLIFQKKYAEPLRMKIKESGVKESIYNSAEGRIMIESKDMAEILYLTKYIGNYNITKIGGAFIFENEGYAVIMEKL
jgi:hypothetical protein